MRLVTATCCAWAVPPPSAINVAIVSASFMNAPFKPMVKKLPALLAKPGRPKCLAKRAKTFDPSPLPAALVCRGIGCPVMNDCSKDLNQTDEGDLLSAAEVSDEVIEAASIMVRGGLPTLWYGTYCFGCPSRPAIGGQAAHEGRGAADRG